MLARLDFTDVTHAYDHSPVLKGVSFQVEPGMIACLLGASGCGKTTVLRCIAGFEPVQSGTVAVDQVVMSAKGFTVPPEKRRIGVVFQDYALFPHLTVGGNIAFGLRDTPAPQRDARVGELLDIVGLAVLGAKYPQELSGGQQQRVALARALAPRPQLLLLDEPFSNLDVEMRERLSLEVRDILKRERTTAVLVTHDQNEAFNIADMIGIMKDGRIEQWDTPYRLYHEPQTRYAAEFVGQGHFLPGTLLEDGRVRLGLGEFRPDATLPWPSGTAVDVLLRPDDVLHDDASPLQARVLHRAFRGAEFLYTLQLPDGEQVFSLVPSHHNHAIGEKIGIRLELDHLVAFPHDSSAAQKSA
ncbi:MAG: ABC transporter ATP-binding protein [Burkholderiales bacterium]|nr:ABC transporter ATP-binding protein [Burkholderiales bacterium]MDP3714896.1 ABC transporter ATP-binding protein [Burkholderiales bacterium]